jgi:hypothetical protein
MGRKDLAAVFYARGERPGILSELGVKGETWGPFSQVLTDAGRLDEHTRAIVRFRQYDFFGLRENHEPTESMAADPVLPLAHFFRDAAANAGCEAAFLVTHPHQAGPDWLAGRYWMVLTRDIPSLVAEAFGLLYLDNGMVLDWDAPRLNERNLLPGGPGLTIFASSGWNRWF